MSKPKWIKSSFSEASGNACVEIAFGEDGGDVAIRDSVRPTRVITADPTAFAALLAGLRHSTTYRLTPTGRQAIAREL